MPAKQGRAGAGPGGTKVQKQRRQVGLEGQQMRLEVRAGKGSLRGQPRAVQPLDHLGLLL